MCKGNGHRHMAAKVSHHALLKAASRLMCLSHAGFVAEGCCEWNVGYWSGGLRDQIENHSGCRRPARQMHNRLVVTVGAAAAEIAVVCLMAVGLWLGASRDVAIALAMGRGTRPEGCKFGVALPKTGKAAAAQVGQRWQPIVELGSISLKGVDLLFCKACSKSTELSRAECCLEGCNDTA